MGGVLFILHPYCLEVVVWKACVHYLLSCMAILAILLFLFQYISDTKRVHILKAGIIYTLSLFTLEISFITPLAVSLVAIVFAFTIPFERKKYLIYFSGLLWTLLAGYLLLNLITLGSLVGHYGAEVHYRFDFLAIISTELKYFFKHIFYARYYSFQQKSLLFDQLLSSSTLVFFIFTTIIALIILYAVRIKKWKPVVHFVITSLVLSALFVLPVSNIYFYHLALGMNDRFSYIPSAFMMMAFIFLLSAIPKKGVRITCIILLLSLHIFLQQKTLALWKSATEILQSLRQDFRWHDASHVFVLNSPDNYHGIKIASIIGEPSGIDELIDYQTEKPYDGIMIDVFQFNMNTPDDGVTAEQTGPMQVKVSFKDWGHWWHRNEIGAGSYENEYYKAEILEYPYLLTFKKFPPGSVIIYQDGMKWKEFQFENVQE
jgi:hypothetical protein